MEQINTKETQNKLFGNIAKKPRITKEENDPVHISPPQNIETFPEPQEADGIAIAATDQATAKWQSFDKITALLTTEQKEGLDRIAKKIMKYRSIALKGKDDKERITANTLLRALVENFLSLEDSLQIEILSSEDDVHTWTKQVFK